MFTNYFSNINLYKICINLIYYLYKVKKKKIKIYKISLVIYLLWHFLKLQLINCTKNYL